MATLAEISAAAAVVQNAGVPLTLLNCTSAYSSPPESMSLRTISHLSVAFDVPVGLSDHTLGTAVPIAAVALGACIIEKHFTLSRQTPGPDSPFSLEPQEFADMVAAVRTAEAALGSISYARTEQEEASTVFRRSLYAVADIAAGEIFTPGNIRSIRPGYGLRPEFLPLVLGRTARQKIVRGTALTWELI